MEKKDNNRSNNRQTERKTQQFCRQVQRALNLALADTSVADIGCDLFVDEVSPGPDCGHLPVHIVVQDNCSVADAMSALRRDHRDCARRWRWQLRAKERQNWRLCRSRCKEAAMSDSSKSPLRSWLAAPLDSDVSEALERLRRAPEFNRSR